MSKMIRESALDGDSLFSALWRESIVKLFIGIDIKSRSRGFEEEI